MRHPGLRTGAHRWGASRVGLGPPIGLTLFRRAPGNAAASPPR